MKHTIIKYIGVFCVLFTVPVVAFAQDDAAPALNSGDTAWIIVATILVMMMTIPGLALFYGGLVRRK
ncbi:MAG: ammonia channel protein, partial [Proteiniphilum sp.]